MVVLNEQHQFLEFQNMPLKCVPFVLAGRSVGPKTRTGCRGAMQILWGQWVWDEPYLGEECENPNFIDFTREFRKKFRQEFRLLIDFPRIPVGGQRRAEFVISDQEGMDSKFRIRPPNRGESF